MAVPTFLTDGTDKVLCLVDQGENARYMVAIETSNSPAGYGWQGVATHAEGDVVLSPGGITTTAAPVVLVAGDNGTTIVPLQLGAGTATAALRTTSASNDPAVTALEIMDDWDESDRAKVNPIAGQAGIAAGAGVVGVTVPRTTLASNDPAVTALEKIDDWDEGDRAMVNVIVGQAGIAAGAGAVGVTVPRMTLASNDPAVALLTAIDADTSVLAAAVSTEMQVDVVAALPAGANAIGKLAANTGVDIGDVDVTSVPAPLNVTDGGTEAAALRVTLANNSTGLVSVDDNGSSLTVDGNLGDAGVGYTPITKYLAKSTTADATIWDPTAARMYITDIIISVSGTAVDVNLAFGSGTALTDVVLKFHGDVRGGLTHQFRTPIKSGTDNFNLNISLSAAQAMTITVLGYEAAS